MSKIGRAIDQTMPVKRALVNFPEFMASRGLIPEDWGNVTVAVLPLPCPVCGGKVDAFPAGDCSGCGAGRPLSGVHPRGGSNVGIVIRSPDLSLLGSIVLRPGSLAFDIDCDMATLNEIFTGDRNTPWHTAGKLVL